MSLDAAGRDREAKGLAVSLAGVEIEAREAQPADGEVFQGVADLEDAQHSCPGARGRGRPAPVHTRTGARARRRGRSVRRRGSGVGVVATRSAREGLVDEGGDALAEDDGEVEVEHCGSPQNGMSSGVSSRRLSK